MSSAPLEGAAPAAATSAPSTSGSPFHALVLDANAFITGTALHGLAEQYYTVEAVKAELKDERARAVLATLPYELVTRRPAEASIEAVKAFARKTGDYGGLASKLSATDILVLALVHQLERQANGDRFLRTEPPAAVTTAGLPPRERPLCRFFNKPSGCREGEGCKFRHEALPAAPAPATGGGSEGSAGSVGGGVGSDEAVAVSGAEASAAGAVHASAAAAGVAAGEASTAVSGVKLSSGVQLASPLPAAAAAPAATAADDDDDDDGGEWITAGTSDKHDGMLPFGDELVGRTAEADPLSTAAASGRKLVGLLTSDYPMQNVALQMGLLLATSAGKLITSVKSWVLKCDACFTIQAKTDRLFCEKCGNAALARLGVTLGADGAPRYHYKKNRTFNLRGTVFALPTVKGGRSAEAQKSDLLLREDQLLTGRWAQKARMKTRVESMFAEGVASAAADPTSGLSRVVRGDASIQVGYGRKNPNEAKRRR